MKDELIGKVAEIDFAGRTFKGIIVDETKNTLSLETDSRTVQIIKKNAILRIGDKTIQGSTIAKRSEERIKG